MSDEKPKNSGQDAKDAKVARRPSIFKRLTGAATGTAEKPTATSGPLINETQTQSQPPAEAPPPAYNAAAADQRVEEEDVTAADEAEAANLTAAFENLDLTNAPVDPTVETCLAHLKLLAAIQWLKEDVGFTDGLWGLWDAHAGPIDPVLIARPTKDKDVKAERDGEVESAMRERYRDKNLQTLSRIREKRWAVFVARAVDRYETWWKRLASATRDQRLTQRRIEQSDPEYLSFPTDVEAVMVWTKDMLPPLGES